MSLDQYDAAAEAITHREIAEPPICCEAARGGECPAFVSAWRWYRLQTGLQAAIRELSLMIATHDASDGASCLCANVVETRAIRTVLLESFQRVELLLVDLAVQVLTKLAREKRANSGGTAGEQRERKGSAW